jgi:hypothetical protein
LQPLLRNPLLLTFLVILAGETPQTSLPERRTELYRQYVDKLLASWETRRSLQRDPEGQPLFSLAGLSGNAARQAARHGFYYLGWRLHLAYYGGQAQTPPDQTTLTADLAVYLGHKQPGSTTDEREALAAAVIQFWLSAGILDEWRLERQTFLAFRHMTFQEYAAAISLAEAWAAKPDLTWTFLRPRLHLEPWREPILMLAGLLPEADCQTLVRHLLRRPSTYERVLHCDLRLAAAIMAEGVQLSDKLVCQIIHRLRY